MSSPEEMEFMEEESGRESVSSPRGSSYSSSDPLAVSRGTGDGQEYVLRVMGKARKPMNYMIRT